MFSKHYIRMFMLEMFAHMLGRVSSSVCSKKFCELFTLACHCIKQQNRNDQTMEIWCLSQLLSGHACLFCFSPGVSKLHFWLKTIRKCKIKIPRYTRAYRTGHPELSGPIFYRARMAFHYILLRDKGGQLQKSNHQFV